MSKGDFKKSTESIIPLRGVVRDGVLASILDQDGNELGAPATVKKGVTGRMGISSAGREFMQAYLGQVASRCFVPTTGGSANKQLMARSRHIASDNIDGPQLVYVNWWATTGGIETAGGADCTYSASIEYPIGTVTRVTFGGSNSGVCVDGGQIVSDVAALKIPKGAVFFVRTFQNHPGGILFANRSALNNVGAAVPASGEWWDYGVTSTDYTGSATNINNKGVGNFFAPAAIIGLTTRPSFVIVGDSRSTPIATYETLPNAVGGIGECERSLCKSFGTINVSISGDSFVNALTNFVRRATLAQYASHVIIELGINGFTLGRTAAQTLADLSLLTAKFPNQTVFAATVSPKSTSTDAWATTGNQTADATSNAARIAYNDALRTGQHTASIAGFVEIADQVESARNSGIWKATGVANGYTFDGLHESSGGFAAIELAGPFAGVGF